MSVNSLTTLGKAKYITTLGLTKGYWQITLAPDSKEKIDLTHLGIFQFTTMPFALSGALATFQRLMDQELCHHT